MRTRGIATVRELAAAGCLTLDGRGVPTLHVPRDQWREAREDMSTIKAVLRRVQAFLPQLGHPGSSADPFLRIREFAPWMEGRCRSCGQEVQEHDLPRCDLCACAAGIALQLSARARAAPCRRELPSPPGTVGQWFRTGLGDPLRNPFRRPFRVTT